MTTIHKCSMRKSEFIALMVASVIAGCTSYHFPTDDEPQSKPAKVRPDEPPAEKAAIKLAPIKTKAIGKAPDFSAFKDVKVKKMAFFAYLNPGIEIENERVTAERKQLEALNDKLTRNTISAADTNYAKQLGKRYKVDLPAEGVSQAWIKAMRHRVDVIPKALVFVQAANESAWGSSRFATQANNYFGQWCYRKGCGIVPYRRRQGMSHEVAKFSSAQQSIHGYFMNVNSNKAYQALREIRYQRHLNKQSLTDTKAAMALTRGLMKYSERGEAYVNDLQAMIRHNQAFWTSNTTTK